MPQLKCELSKEELEDFERMMSEYGIESRYGMVKVLVVGALDEWRKRKVERGEIRGQSNQPVKDDSGTDKANESGSPKGTPQGNPKKRIF
jgi:hypothetical protein